MSLKYHFQTYFSLKNFVMSFITNFVDFTTSLPYSTCDDFIILDEKKLLIKEEAEKLCLRKFSKNSQSAVQAQSVVCFQSEIFWRITKFSFINLFTNNIHFVITVLHLYFMYLCFCRVHRKCTFSN